MSQLRAAYPRDDWEVDAGDSLAADFAKLG
jgi:hypothetical protein